MAKLTALQVAAAAKLGGFPDAQIPTAVAVARGESSFDTTSSNSCCSGLWQIHRTAHADKIKAAGGNVTDPVVNARLAYQIYSAAGGWCTTGRIGQCNPWQAYGMDNAGMKWSAKLAEGQRAYAQLQQQMQAGKTPQQILGSSASIDPVAFPDIPNPLDAVKAVKDVGEVFDAFFRAITSRNTWMRVAEIAIGAMLINFGLQKAVGIDAKKVVNVVVGGKAKAAAAVAGASKGK